MDKLDKFLNRKMANLTNKDKTVIDERLLRIEKLNLGCENGFVWRVNRGANWRWKYLYDFNIN